MTFVNTVDRLQVDPDTGTVLGPRGFAIGWRNADGYIAVRLVDGRCTVAHRLIWEAVHGPIPAGMQINHKTGIKHDNRIANLEVVTPKENVRHAYRTGLASNSGDRSPRAILTSDQVGQIRRRYVKGSSGPNGAQALAQEFGVSRRTIAAIVNGESWPRRYRPNELMRLQREAAIEEENARVAAVIREASAPLREFVVESGPGWIVTADAADEPPAHDHFDIWDSTESCERCQFDQLRAEG